MSACWSVSTLAYSSGLRLGYWSPLASAYWSRTASASRPSTERQREARSQSPSGSFVSSLLLYGVFVGAGVAVGTGEDVGVIVRHPADRFVHGWTAFATASHPPPFGMAGHPPKTTPPQNSEGAGGARFVTQSQHVVAAFNVGVGVCVIVGVGAGVKAHRLAAVLPSHPGLHD